MNTSEIHPLPSGNWFESWKQSDGRVISAFCDSNIGVSYTTPCHVMRLPDGQVEARVGFCVMGAPNMSEEDFKKCGDNPFHPDFHDNYAQAKAATVGEALVKLAADLKSIGDSLWSDFE